MAEARRLGIVGWVKNRDDGGVELEAEGSATQITMLLAWCEQGPPAAQVRNVVIAELVVRGVELQFDITW